MKVYVIYVRGKSSEHYVYNANVQNVLCCRQSCSGSWRSVPDCGVKAR